MPRDMTAHIDRDRQPRDMGGIGLDRHAKRCRNPAEALRADVQFVDEPESVPFHLGVIGIGMRPVERPAERPLRQTGAELKISALSLIHI